MIVDPTPPNAVAQMWAPHAGMSSCSSRNSVPDPAHFPASHVLQLRLVDSKKLRNSNACHQPTEPRESWQSPAGRGINILVLSKPRSDRHTQVRRSTQHRQEPALRKRTTAKL